jgi:hypothetical protein
MLLMGLRLKEGINPKAYARLAGRELDRARLSTLLDEELLKEDIVSGHLAATLRGRRVLNAVIAALALAG